MAKAENESFYDTWNEHWEKESKLTIPGRIMTSARIKALKETIQDLDIKTAIDVGCGLGYLLQLFKDANFDYIGLDVSARSVAICQKKELHAKLGKLEEERNHYDLVASEGMLEHFLNFEPYVKHMTRISKRYVLLMQPNHDSFTGRTLVYLAQCIRKSKIVFEYNYQIKDYITVFENNGFKILKNEPVFVDTSRLLLFEKK